MLEAEIRDLQIQPMKGGGSLKLTKARMTRAGLETVDGRVKDHFLVVVTDERDKYGDHNFFTQRVQVDPDKNLFVPGTPRLSLVRPELWEDRLILSFDGKNEISVPDPEQDHANIIPVQVWEYRGKAVEVPVLSGWLSENLERDVLVVRTSGPWDRMARQNFMVNDNPLRSQDGYPVHSVNWEDAKRVFEAISAPVDPNRFRYQVLLEGLPFREIHNYAKAEINGVEVDQGKPCDRCEVTGIDQEKGEFSRIKPLAGLARSGARRWVRPDNGNKVQIMGENWLPRGETIIRIGDSVTFTEVREVPLQFEDLKQRPQLTS